jgi:hypothetical protein
MESGNVCNGDFANSCAAASTNVRCTLKPAIREVIFQCLDIPVLADSENWGFQ